MFVQNHCGHPHNRVMILAPRTLRMTLLNIYRRHVSTGRRCPPILLSSSSAHFIGSPKRRYTTFTSSSGVNISEVDDEFFGIYSVILPPEPFVFGVSHITQRPVPPHILRPPYVTSSGGGAASTSGDGRIQLGSSRERRLRSAAKLARNVLEYAGTLVKVKTGWRRHSLIALTLR